MKVHQLIIAAVLALYVSTAVEARKEKTVICHVGNEAGPSGEEYLDDPGCVPIEENGYFCPDAGKIDLISVANANKHLNNPNHEWDGISDYLPGDIGASGEGDTDTDSDGIDEGCEPASVLRVFVSRQVNLTAVTASSGNGALGVDATCQAKADAASLGGTWMAWASDSTTSPDARFNKSVGPYKLVNGTLIANSYTDLTDGTIANPINIDEFGSAAGGNRARTGTLSNGLVATGEHCSDWTNDTQNTPYGAVGRYDQTNASWSRGAAQFCTDPTRIYCFEQ